MSDQNTPFIKLGNDGESAPMLKYNLPESTNYVGYHVIAVDIDEAVLNESTKQTLQENLAKKQYLKAKKTIPQGKSTKAKMLNYVVRKNADKIAAEVSSEAPKRTNPLPAPKRTNARVLKIPRERFNGFNNIMQTVKVKPREEKIAPKILFYERIQISNYLGNYGAGKVIKTFSLFPGEKTKISINTYKESLTTEESNSGSSILDSTSESATTDFQNSLMSESSLKYSDEEADIMYSENIHSENESAKKGQGSASALWGIAKASGGGSSHSKSNESHQVAGEWGTRSSRDKSARNISNALSKHASRASSKRDIKINTSTATATSTENSKQVSIEREIENINLSSTLNLVFRQMNQEFVSVTHLTDVQIALYDETGGPYPKYALHELDQFLEDYFVDDDAQRQSIKNSIIKELYYVFNYTDQPKQFIEKKILKFPTDHLEDLALQLPENVEFLRVKKDTQDTVLESEHIKVNGVILDVNTIVMRTDGVVVDAFLGKGKAIDDYNIKLQNESVRNAKLSNDKMELALEVVHQIDEPHEKANLLTKNINNTKADVAPYKNNNP